MAHRSTTLGLFARTCARALDHYDARMPYDRTVYQTGIAAHAVLQIAGQHPDRLVAEVADAVVHELTTTGRAFDGDPEAPMPVEAAAEGARIALGYLAHHDLSPTARYEVGLAAGSIWQAVPYSRDAHYVAALDVLDLIEDSDDDGYASTVAVARDYKTSWATGSADLESLQMRGQAVLAAIHHPEAAIVRREVVSLRTGQTYAADLVLDDDGTATLARWRRDLDALIAAADHRGPDGRRPASPGACCVGCPYVLRCDAARAWWAGSVPSDPVGMATAYAVLEAARDALAPLVKAAAADGAIGIPGGSVGFVATPQRSALATSASTVAREWFHVRDAGEWEAANGAWLGLLDAIGVGVSAVENVAKRLHPGRGPTKRDGWREAREELVDRCVASGVVAKFGIHRAPAATVNADAQGEEVPGASLGDVGESVRWER